MPTAITIRKVEGKPGQVYYPLETMTLPTPSPKPTEVVIQMSAAALNHRDHFIRQHLYPGTTFGVPLLADGCGIVTSTGSDESAKKWHGKRVIICPQQGWKDQVDGPEAQYAILGGTKTNPNGTLGEVLVIDAAELEEAPQHLNDIEAAALPLTGLTAWRSTFTKNGTVQSGRNVLVTGIGGGVAIMALLFAVAAGAKVWVSSGSEEKIQRAKELGAQGGVNYKEPDWEKKLAAMLPADRKVLDSIIDGAGGDIVQRGVRLLRPGGAIVSYGMTLGPQVPYLMGAVLKNVDIRGVSMGSRAEFAEMIKFVNEKKLKPVVSRTVQGLDIQAIDSLFDDMKNGRQFGKLVVDLSQGNGSSRL